VKRAAISSVADRPGQGSPSSSERVVRQWTCISAPSASRLCSWNVQKKYEMSV